MKVLLKSTEVYPMNTELLQRGIYSYTIYESSEDQYFIEVDGILYSPGRFWTMEELAKKVCGG